MRPKPEKPGPGQESVWDYPRPPRLEPVGEEVKVVYQDEIIAQTVSAYRVLETSHPPVYYIPQADINMQRVTPVDQQSWCEWKGMAQYYDVSAGGQTARQAAWGYDTPAPAFAKMAGHLAFYAQAMQACYVGDEQVQPQPGGFYGGWITTNITGPFKGEPGTMGW